MSSNTVIITNGSNRLIILVIIIHQIFSLAREWSKRATWPNMPQLELGNIRVTFPNFQKQLVLRNIFEGWQTRYIASIWRENMLGFSIRFSQQIMSADKYRSIFSRKMEALVYSVITCTGIFITDSILCGKRDGGCTFYRNTMRMYTVHKAQGEPYFCTNIYLMTRFGDLEHFCAFFVRAVQVFVG